MWTLILVGCVGEFGLQGDGTRPVRDAADTGEADDGQESGEGADAETDGERVAVSLDGATWSLDLTTVTFTPEGVGSLVSLLDTTKLLFHAIDQSEDRLTLVAAMAGADGAQNPCERVVSLPPATWENPWFRLDEGVLRLMAGGEPMDIQDALLTAVVSPDGSAWSGGSLDGTLDARQVNAGLGDGWDVCSLVEDMGGECHACDDGEVQCFDLHVDAITATAITTGFDPYVDDGAC